MIKAQNRPEAKIKSYMGPLVIADHGIVLLLTSTLTSKANLDSLIHVIFKTERVTLIFSSNEIFTPAGRNFFVKFWNLLTAKIHHFHIP